MVLGSHVGGRNGQILSYFDLAKSHQRTLTGGYYLLAKVVHGGVDEALRKLLSSELLPGGVDVVDAEVWK